MVDIPRITLPESITSVLTENDLKDPNALGDREYSTYSAAAIAGTLVLFLPGSFVFGFLPGLVGDFVFSALLGGGLCAFLALRTDGIAEKVNELGGKALDAAGGIDIPRITLPDAVASQLGDLDLKNPNSLADRDYSTYSAAAIAGTLVLFLPLSFAFGFLPALLGDFVLSALVGGGLCAYLALRKDGIADTVNELGGKLLDAID